MTVYWIWLAELKGIGLRNKRQLLEFFRDPEEIFLAKSDTLPPEIAKALEDKDLSAARAIEKTCARQNIGILTYADEAYPEMLRTLEDPPLVLYYQGKLPDWQAQPLIGVVGTRKASPYGLHTARLLSAQIAACGGMVVSGAAAGVDAASMEGALETGKAVVGVLGGGVDVVYPAKNRELYRKTRENGCLLSEYPPGSSPFGGNFLQRNRIISGISDGVLVVEAPARSGALSTANHAFSQGRDLFAVPGNLGVASCEGSNGLLQEGAYAVLSGWDVVKHYETIYPEAVKHRSIELQERRETPITKVAQPAEIPEMNREKKETPAKIAIDNKEESTYSVINKRPTALSDQESAILDLVGTQPELPDSIMDRSDLPSGTVQSILTRLAIKGLVQQHPDGRISRK